MVFVNFNDTTTKPSESENTSWVPLFPIIQDAMEPWGPADNRSTHAEHTDDLDFVLPFGEWCSKSVQKTKTGMKVIQEGRC